MSDFPPLGQPGGSFGGTAPTSGPAPGWWQASDGNWYPPEQQPGYGGQAYGMPTGYGYSTPTATAATNGWAIASLIVSLVSCGLGSILGVIFGHIALSRIKQTGAGGRGLAIAGLIIGYLGLAIMVVAIVAVVAVGDDVDRLDRFDGVGGIVGLVR